MLRLRGKVHRGEVSRKTSVSSGAGYNGGISRAHESIRRYLLPTWAVLSFPSAAAVSVLHIYCRDSALISSVVILLSLLPAIVSYTSGSYVVVRRRRVISLLLGHLASTWHRFYFVVRKTVLRKGSQSVSGEHCALSISKSARNRAAAFFSALTAKTTFIYFAIVPRVKFARYLVIRSLKNITNNKNFNADFGGRNVTYIFKREEISLSGE